MALLISNAILHTLCAQQGGSLFSDVELDIESESCREFLTRHVRRLLNNPGAREASFKAESPVYALVKSYQKEQVRFREMSLQLCEQLSLAGRDIEELETADVLVVAFDNGDKRYLAVLRLAYGECYTHKLVKTENSVENQIVKNTTVLPLSASKVEEACLIPWDPMILRIIEKPRLIAGEQRFYFSELFLQCETQISKKEAVERITEVAGEINDKYFCGNVEMEAKLKCALLDESETVDEDNGLVLENVAKRAFEENEQAKAEFVELAKQAGLPYELKLDKPVVQREFSVQKFKADNGIELKCPSELFCDPDYVTLHENPDGTVTITLKNLRKYDPFAV